MHKSKLRGFHSLNSIPGSIRHSVQFRSESLPEYQNGRVHGYQVEIDPLSEPGQEAYMMKQDADLLYTLESNPEGRKAFKPGEWNHYRAEAIGTNKTWVNGIPCADVVDYLTPSDSLPFRFIQSEKIKRRPDYRLNGKTSE